jgi:hypothetical protein
MANLQKRRMFQVMPTVAILTILSGARLMMIASGGDAHWFVHRVGHAYSVSAAFGVLALLIGLFVARPAMTKAGTLSQGMASDGASRELLAAEIAKLQRRGALSSTVATVFLVLAAAGMAVARYM